MASVAIGTMAHPQPRVICYDDFETDTIDLVEWSENPHVDPNPNTSMAADSSPYDSPSERWAAQQLYRVGWLDDGGVSWGNVGKPGLPSHFLVEFDFKSGPWPLLVRPFRLPSLPSLMYNNGGY
jgi:hypothetical protein